jgi:hypothetical protein
MVILASIAQERIAVKHGSAARRARPEWRCIGRSEQAFERIVQAFERIVQALEARDRQPYRYFDQRSHSLGLEHEAINPSGQRKQALDLMRPGA